MSTIITHEVKIQLLDENSRLSDEIRVQGAILNPSQKILINFKLSLALQSLVNLQLDPEHPQDFIQNQSFLKGEIATYGNLLDSSKEAEIESANLAQNQ